MPADNLVINYGRRIPDFDFSAFAANSRAYFSAIDSLSSLALTSEDLEAYEEKDPYIVQQINAVSWLLGLIFIGLPLILVLGIGYLAYRWWKRR